MPYELLRDVLMRIEASEVTWPTRKTMVYCAGVCRNWREIMKELVKTPEISSKLTFPISLKQPSPRDSLLQCYIKRNCNNQTYYLYLGLNQSSNEDGKFLLAARKCRQPTCTDYIISLNADDVSKGSNTYIGKLRLNFLGTKFAIYDSEPPNVGAKVTKCCSTRLMNAKQIFPRIEFLHSNLDTFPSLPFIRSKSTRTKSSQFGPLSSLRDGMLVLKNKAPRWHEQLQCWCLKFNGRVTIASVKNFQLVAFAENVVVRQEQQENVILQFGKVGKDVFTMDYQYPISAFQAFAICLSSFDTKIACE
ncbi:tubby-like F-box protein 3 isoform X2 [Gossypium australe]|uniref:Tubby-like F-box protein 3 isoform X2 n=1 Tax=Gossypium australe TaxID=47621 RepID=A0A5B6VPV9_9ROSI|nr:tubby-like F-box protein 3 isoform X2 [Gossypium australe]